MYWHYVKVDSDEDVRQSKMAANSKSHAVSQTAYTGAIGNSCCLGDGIQCEGVKVYL